MPFYFSDPASPNMTPTEKLLTCFPTKVNGVCNIIERTCKEYRKLGMYLLEDDKITMWTVLRQGS